MKFSAMLLIFASFFCVNFNVKKAHGEQLWHYDVIDQEYEIISKSTKIDSIEYTLKRNYRITEITCRHDEYTNRDTPVNGISKNSQKHSWPGINQGISTKSYYVSISEPIFINNELIKLTIRTNPGWVFLKNGSLNIYGYSSDILKGACIPIFPVALEYEARFVQNHKDGGGPTFSRELETLEVAKIDKSMLNSLASDILERQLTKEVELIPEDAISRSLIVNADIRIKAIPPPDLTRKAADLVPPSEVADVISKINTGRISGYKFWLFRSCKYKVEIRHPDYRFTEAVIQVSDDSNSVHLQIGDKGPRVRVIANDLDPRPEETGAHSTTHF